MDECDDFLGEINEDGASSFPSDCSFGRGVVQGLVYERCN